MNPLEKRAIAQIEAVSGTLRVLVQPSPNWMFLLVQAGIIAAFSFLGLRSWVTSSMPERIFIAATVVGAVLGWFAQLSRASEVIEFDQNHLRIRKEIFGWERTRDYPIEQCSDLKPQDESGDPHGLEC